MKKVFNVVLVAIGGLMLVGCEDAVPLVVEFDGLSPAMGPVGSTVIVHGKNFDTNISKNVVRFKDVEAEILEATSDYLIVKVPETPSGFVSIESRGKKFYSNYRFEVIEAIGGSWDLVAVFPGSYRAGGLTFSDDEFGFVGLGQGGGQPTLKDFWKFDPVADTWTRLNDFPGAPSYIRASFVLDGKAYVFMSPVTGNDDEHLWVYDIETDTWNEKGGEFHDQSSMGNFGPHYVAAALSHQSFGIIATYGEFQDERFPGDLFPALFFEKYDPVANAWDSLAVVGYDVAYGGVTYPKRYLGSSVNSQLFLYDADFFSTYSLSSNEVLHESQYSSGQLWLGMKGFSCATSNGNVYVGLGTHPYFENGYYNNVWGYETSTKTWFAVTPSPYRRISHVPENEIRTFEINGKTYILFGYDENGPSNKVIEFTP